jgi:iron(III) transport system ATP-binding protein
MKNSLLQVSGVEKRFSGNPSPAVKDFSLSLRRGEIYALVGESGSGKTTVLRLIAGLANPDKGRIRLNGREVFGPGVNLPCEKRRIGMVFQEAALFPNLRLIRNVAFGLRGKGAEKRSRAADYLDLVGLGKLAGRYPHELSGGQRQRAALARALAMEPDLILMDEPFSSLDIRIKKSVVEQVGEILANTEATALLVTHSIDEAFSLAKHIGVMRDGALEQEGRADELYRSPVSGYVADFLGAANILTISEFQSLIHRGLTCPDIGAEGTEDGILLRPEDILLTTREIPGTLAGRIERSNFIGDRREYIISAPPVHLRVRTPSDKIFPEGAKVRFSIKKESLSRLSTANLH